QLAGDPAAAARLVADHGLVCTDLLSLRVSRDDAATMAAAHAAAPAVDALGGPLVVALMWTRVSEESIDRLGRVADALGTRVALEFVPGPVATMAAAEELATAVGADRLAVLADTFHHFRAGGTPAMLDAVDLDRLPIVQFADALPVA